MTATAQIQQPILISLLYRGHAVAAGNAAVQNMRKKKGKRAD